MSFKEALAAEKPRRQCKVCDLQAVLDPADWSDLTDSLADDTINSASITRALAASLTGEPAEDDKPPLGFTTELDPER